MRTIAFCGSASQLRPSPILTSKSSRRHNFHRKRLPLLSLTPVAPSRPRTRSKRHAGAVCILLTSQAHAPIGDHADLQLISAGDAMVRSPESVARRIAHLSLIDAHYVAMSLRCGMQTGEAVDRIGQALARRTR